MQLNSDCIDKLLKNGFITSNDIINIFSLNNNEFLNFYPTRRTQKQKIVCNIYLNPACLYNCKYISEKLVTKLVDFVIYQYNSNKDETQYRYELGQISKEEYDNLLKVYDKYYFPLDNYVARNIKRKMESEQKVLLK